jgi:hypothetical protein
MVAKMDMRSRSSRDVERTLLEALSETLSQDEMRRVTAAALLALDELGIDRLAARLEEDTGRTVRRVLAACGEGKEPPGKGKVLEEWENVWAEWRERIEESGREGGDYVIQEHHWEAPYLDVTALTDDLEKVAVRMRTLLPRIVEEDLAPEFSFRDAIVETLDDIGVGLPEWMDNSEGCTFGPQVTGCLLDWERRVALREKRDMFSVLDGICHLDCSESWRCLDPGAVSDFVFGLNQTEQQAIIDGIKRHRQEPHWAAALDDVHSGWFAIFQELACRCDPELFADSCRQNVSRDWRLALPLLKDLLRKKAFKQAEPLIEQAAAGLLHLDSGGSWDPRQGLLICARGYHEHSLPAVVSLLQAWCRVARGLGRGDVAAALELQQVVTEAWEDWDRVLAAFQRVQTPDLARICDRLFADWRARVVQACIRRHGETVGGLDSRWLCALADLARAGDAGAGFHDAVRSWLAEIGRTPKSVLACKYALAMLTLDVDTGGTLKRTAPALQRILLEECRNNDRTSKSRRSWVKRLHGAKLLPEVVAFWKLHAVDVVPDPANAFGSNYDDCAGWMAVVLELNPEAYQRILRAWSVKHKLRRNLWRAFQERNLPGR